MDPKTEMEIQMTLTAAKEMGKKVLFPEIRTFGELFRDPTAIVHDYSKYQAKSIHTWRLAEGGSCHLMSFCSLESGRFGLDVDPHHFVVDAVHDHMLMSKDYHYNFRITPRNNGTAVVSCHYDRILGDRWVAIIDSATIPGLKKEEEEEEEEEEEDVIVESLDEPLVLNLFNHPTEP